MPPAMLDTGWNVPLLPPSLLNPRCSSLSSRAASLEGLPAMATPSCPYNQSKVTAQCDVTSHLALIHVPFSPTGATQQGSNTPLGAGTVHILNPRSSGLCQSKNNLSVDC